jgi:hypothetical protein
MPTTKKQSLVAKCFHQGQYKQYGKCRHQCEQQFLLEAEPSPARKFFHARIYLFLKSRFFASALILQFPTKEIIEGGTNDCNRSELANAFPRRRN